jgi:organic radical activating enzyme
MLTKTESVSMDASMIKDSLPVMEDFYTIQGEGFHQGKAAYFVRLAGCDVGCVWCDVKESWDVNKHPYIKIEEIVNKIKAASTTNMVVITGGEPLMHHLQKITTDLHEGGYKTHIETSGAHPLSGDWDWICLSPKKFKSPLDEILPLANELKIVIFNKSDFEWAENYASKMNPNCKLYLQPEWDKSAIVTPLIIEYVKNNPKWQISLQLHKYIHVP